MRSFVLRTLAAIAILAVAVPAAAGEIDPPVPPSPTMVALDLVEPRLPVQALPASTTAVHRIEQPGSYFLAGDIVGVSGKSGIEIAADNVTIDLMGFSVIGVSGSLSGISVPNSQEGITIRNGVICDWGGSGVDGGFASTSQLLDLRVIDNATAGPGQGGLTLGSGLIARCNVRGSSNFGVSISSGAVVDCSARNNGFGFVSAGATFTNCEATGNSTGGFSLSRSAASDCAAVLNLGYGFDVSMSTITDCLAQGNSTDGIVVGDMCTVRGNECHANTGDGIEVPATTSWTRIEGNNATLNGRGIAVGGTGNLIIRNTASGNTGTTNFAIGAGNSYGPIVTAIGAGDIGSLTNSDHPWANFEY